MSSKAERRALSCVSTANSSNEEEEIILNENDLETHIAAESSVLSQSEHKCKFCGSVFKIESNGKKHEFYHKLTFSILCSCGKRFAISNNLRRHAKNMHKESTPFSCNHCASRFKTFLPFERHMSNNHLREYTKIYNSSWRELSELSTLKSSTLKRSSTSKDDHQSTNKSSKPEPSSTPDVSGDNNYERIQVMIPIQVRKKQFQFYRCKLMTCYTSFKTIADLHRHCWEQHEQSFFCRYCHNIYKNKKNRKTHERVHVLCVTLTSDWERKHYDLAKLTDIEHHNRSLECKYCRDEKKFRKISHLHKHMAHAHTLNLPIYCTCCQMWFEEESFKDINHCRSNCIEQRDKV